ncbi:uncharacterized protein LOC109837790 [Asparagus officinalis]|uniref:uncharacterized protein LOC109837790 n=1 Tax=Asparagus officinalis TaxID=4686 RepID=UPI00098DF283|nr:uncharacterized protein LOC109837790 [Asparagus officinalis]XP_020261736.1 uncharacterized protein LOC109837790 [Asparagus officinalis]
MALHVCLPQLRAKPTDRFQYSLTSRFPTSSAKIKVDKHGLLSNSDFCLCSWQKMGTGISILKCSSSDNNQSDVHDSNKLVELPLFPLSLVLFPGTTLPLQIFEFKYRIMMHTLLQSDLRFGIVYSDNSTGTFDVGCVGEIVKHEKLVDDRFFIICEGQERFRVINLVRTKPYLVAEVQWLEDRPSANGQDQDLESLALEVETCMKDVIRISNKLNGEPEKEAKDLRRNLFPTPFSFFVGSTFEGAPKEQQALLELEDTALRLRREKETLKNTLNYVAAASAVKDALQYSSSSEN